MWRRAIIRLCRYLVMPLVCLMAWTPVGADPGRLPRVAIIIDDMGNSLGHGTAAIGLPGAITYAFLPHRPFARRLAERAYGMHKEIMLHLPMESGAGGTPGPGALTLNMTELELRQTLQAALASVPHVMGVNNHMGSLLTRHPGAMHWVMQTLQEYGDLYFIDSRTTTHTVAEQLAREQGLANGRRDVFLDNIQTPEAIRAQLRLLVREARERGRAIGIGHPHARTIEVLQQELPRLQAEGIRLVPASAVIEKHPRRLPWHASSSPLPKVVKSSKQ